MSDSAAPIVELRHVGKNFAGVRALDDVSLAIQPGEIHCLAGENGSGKSTIIKIISGVIRPDQGELLFDGKPIAQQTPMSAVAAGVQVIFQDFSLFPNLTVAENLALSGVSRARPPLVSESTSIWTPISRASRRRAGSWWRSRGP
jgi:simple sugar transport system ATP-binding protein